MKILIALLIVTITTSSLLASVTGSVTATKLNIRVKPGTKYAVVTQLKKGDKVQVISHNNEWYEIAAPKSTAVWIAAAFIKDGKIIKSVHLRSGPSVAFSSFIMAKAGTPVKIVDQSRKDWVKIEPPPFLTAWTSAKYVFITPENAAKLAGTKISKEDTKKSATDLPPEKNDKKDIVKKVKKDVLPFTDGKGKDITVEGFLVTLSKESTYVTHAIASRINGEYFPLCYVHSKDHNLKLWEGRRVNVTGKQRWVKNWQRPVVEVNKIAPAW